MNRHRQSATWLGAAVGTACALLILGLEAHASDHRGALTEEFHQTYAMTADGRDRNQQYQRRRPYLQLGSESSKSRRREVCRLEGAVG